MDYSKGGRSGDGSEATGAAGALWKALVKPSWPMSCTSAASSSVSSDRSSSSARAPAYTNCTVS